MEDNARLFSLYRVHRFAVGETPVTYQLPCSPTVAHGALLCKAHHALREPNLAQLLVLLLAQLLLFLRIAMAQLRARLGGLGVVEDDLLVKRLVRRAEGGIVYRKEGQLRRDNFGYGGGRHSSWRCRLVYALYGEEWWAMVMAMASPLRRSRRR